jgi:exosortase/archaeosortase family protein
MMFRYLFILIIGLGMSILYIILTPMTIYPSSFILGIFYPTSIQGNSIIVNNIPIILVPACVAGSAFYLLILLNLSTPMNSKKRILSIIFSLLLFLIINVLRIVIFSALFVNSFQYFDFTHKLFWHILSGVIVFLVWIFTIKSLKIKEIPFYTDLIFLYKKSKKH